MMKERSPYLNDTYVQSLGTVNCGNIDIIYDSSLPEGENACSSITPTCSFSCLPGYNEQHAVYICPDTFATNEDHTQCICLWNLVTNMDNTECICIPYLLGGANIHHGQSYMFAALFIVSFWCQGVN